MNDRYHGKRFWSLMLVTVLLAIGYAWGNPETFGSYSTTLVILYGAYLAGQSATDWQKAKNGD